MNALSIPFPNVFPFPGRMQIRLQAEVYPASVVIHDMSPASQVEEQELSGPFVSLVALSTLCFSSSQMPWLQNRRSLALSHLGFLLEDQYARGAPSWLISPFEALVDGSLSLDIQVVFVVACVCCT